MPHTLDSDRELAIRVATFIDAHLPKPPDCTRIMDLVMLDTGAWELTYSDQFPPARVFRGAVTFPKGSPESVVSSFLGGL